VHGRSCYLVPRADGSVVVGATVEERGFDRTVQAGAVHALLADARSLVPGVDELELVECIAGLRPGTPDNGPFVGWTAVQGLAVATGHYRNGILLTPITADAVLALLTDGRVPAALERFDVGRAERAGWLASRDAGSAIATGPRTPTGGRR
jgi:glycine oxidase